MNKNQWTLVAVGCLVVLLIFLVGASLLGGWGVRRWGWMGPGMMGPWMMGGWGHGMFGWLGMLTMWMLPFGLVILIVLGVIWLVRAIGGANPPSRACPNCGRAAQADWKTCPYCGHTLP